METSRSSRPTAPPPQPVLGSCHGYRPSLDERTPPPRWVTWTARVALLAVAVLLVVVLVRWG